MAPFSDKDIVLIKGRGTDAFRRITLLIKGMTVHCDARVCRAKIECCDQCPLLSQKVSQIKNYFIRGVVKTTG